MQPPAAMLRMREVEEEEDNPEPAAKRPRQEDDILTSGMLFLKT